MKRSPGILAGALAVGLALAVALAACGDDGRAPRAPAFPGGDVTAGKSAIREYGCGSCHEIPGVDGADGLVGPPLHRFGRRVYIAGALPNNVDNLVLWIRDPQGVEPGTAMPALGVTEEHARAIAAYLLSLD